MAIYVYECKPCGETFELLRPRPDRNAHAVCPKCGTDKTKRVPIQPFNTTKATTTPATAALPSATGTTQPNSAGPGLTLENVSIINFDTGVGIRIGKGARVKSRGLVLRNNRTALDNSGVFDGPDTVIE